MGGFHVSFLPEEALEYCDSVVMGEAEAVWRDVLADYENGCLKRTYLKHPTEDDYELVHRHLINSPPEIIPNALETSRGCKFRCNFCTLHSFTDGIIHQRPIPEIIALIGRIKQRHKNITLLDANIYLSPARAKEFLTELKPLQVNWDGFSSIDIAKDDEAVRLAKESGCLCLGFGFEIHGGSPERQKGGKLSMASEYLEYAKKIKKAGIRIKGNFIFGFESDDFKSLLRAWKFIFKLRPYWTILSLLTPLPGSPLLADMMRQDRITNLNWRNYNLHTLVFEHSGMNNFILVRAFPVIYIFFLLTTSQGALLLILLFLLSIMILKTGRARTRREKNSYLMRA